MDLLQSMEEKNVVLRDLEHLLQEKLGDTLILDSFTTSSLVAPGENYGSTVLRVDAMVYERDVIRSRLKPRELFLVAKMVPPTEFQKTLFESPVTFVKEIYMFTEIVPAYKDIERECGIPEAEVFDLLPEFFGSRLSLGASEKDKFDDDAVILMENLKMKNYACGDRTTGYDLAHARSAVVALARFHATGVAVKLKKPMLFEEFKTQAKTARVTENMLRSGAECEWMGRILREIPALLPHLPKLEKVLLRSDSESETNATVEPWATIAHADFWVNNIMFRDDASGNPEDVKFVDFQCYRYRNPMRDLVFFLFISCGSKVRNGQIQYLIDLYYEKFMSHLRRLKCDVNGFSRQSLDEQFAVAANLEYLHCVRMVRVLTVDVKDDVSDLELVYQPECSDECREKMAEITLKFVKENWI